MKLFVFLAFSAFIGTPGIRMNQMDKADAIAAAEYLHQLKKVQKDTFNVVACLEDMPRLRHLAWEGASFCRVYPYSCNNLWAEDLNAEVWLGYFCFKNAFERNSDPAVVRADNEAYATFLHNTVAPAYELFMTWLWQLGKASEPAAWAAGAISHPGYVPSKDGESFREMGTKTEDCEAKSKIGEKLRCMLSQLKAKGSEVLGSKNKDSPPVLPKMSGDAALQLVEKAGKVHDQLKVVEDAVRRAEDVGPKLPKWMLKPLKGPLKTSLGGMSYKNSAAYGFPKRTPVSPNHREAQRAVQPGLHMEMYDLANEEEKAVCNDGSHAKIYLNEGEKKDKFHMHVSGGFFCWDHTSCMGRAKLSTPLISTKGWETAINGSGIFDPVLGGLQGYTHGMLGYCSSDAWMGQLDNTKFTLVEGTFVKPGVQGTFHRGYTILQAALRKYLKMGLGSKPGHTFIVSGCSAGGIASTVMADSWIGRLKKLAKEMNMPFFEPKLLTVLDGPPLVSPPPLENPNPKIASMFPGESIAEMAGHLVNLLYGEEAMKMGSPPPDFLNEDCLKAHSDKPVGFCVLPWNVVPYIRIPNTNLQQFGDNFVIAESALMDGAFFTPTTPKHYNYFLGIVEATNDTFKKVTPHQQFFGVNCGDHCIIANPNWWRMRANTAPGKDSLVTAKDLFMELMDGKGGGRVIADTCKQYDCGCLGQGFGYGAVTTFANTVTLAGIETGNWWQMPGTVTTGLTGAQIFPYKLLKRGP